MPPVRYGPADSSQTPRFSGPRTFMRLPLRESLDDVDVAVIGVPTDDAVSFRSGARFGPEGIRSASVLLRPYNPGLGVDVTSHLSMIDFGDAPTVPGYHEETLRRIEAFLAARACGRRDADLHRRRPLDGAGRAAGSGRGTRPARARAPGRARRRVGRLLRRPLLPRHRLSAGRRGGAGRSGASVQAGMRGTSTAPTTRPSPPGSATRPSRGRSSSR